MATLERLQVCGRFCASPSLLKLLGARQLGARKGAVGLLKGLRLIPYAIHVMYIYISVFVCVCMYVLGETRKWMYIP